MRVPSAPVLWGGVIAAVLAADAALVHQDQETMSEWYKRHALVLGGITAYLVLHLNGRPVRFSRYDPLHLAAQAIRSRKAVVIVLPD